MSNPDIEKILDGLCDDHEELLGYLLTTPAGGQVVASRGMVAQVQHLTAVTGVLHAVAGKLGEITQTGDLDRIALTLGSNGLQIVPVGLGALLLVHHHGRDLSEALVSAINRATFECARHL